MFMATCSSASSLQLLFEWLNAGDAKLSTSLFSWVNLHTVIYWYCSPLQQAGLPLVQQYLSQFEKLVMEHMPKLGQHFVEEMINPSMYASHGLSQFSHIPSHFILLLEFGMSFFMRLESNSAIYVFRFRVYLGLVDFFLLHN